MTASRLDPPGTTWFLRDQAEMDVLIAALRRDSPPSRQVRLWSVGCSTGQEAYSLAAVLHSVLGENFDSYKLALVYLATVPRIPQFYYGTEVLMTSPVERDDGKTRNDFPGGWAGDRANAFTGAGLSPRQAQAQAFVRALLNWRKAEPAIHHGRLVHFAPRDGVYVYFRYDDRQRYMIVLNKNREPAALALDRFKEMLGGYAKATEVFGAGAVHALDGTLEEPARAAWVLRLGR